MILMLLDVPASEPCTPINSNRPVPAGRLDPRPNSIRTEQAMGAADQQVTLEALPAFKVRAFSDGYQAPKPLPPPALFFPAPACPTPRPLLPIIYDPGAAARRQAPTRGRLRNPAGADAGASLRPPLSIILVAPLSPEVIISTSATRQPPQDGSRIDDAVPLFHHMTMNPLMETAFLLVSLCVSQSFE